MESTRLPSRRAARLAAAPEPSPEPTPPQPTADVPATVVGQTTEPPLIEECEPPRVPLSLPAPAEPGWLTVRAAHWLSPDEALAVVQGVAPQAELAMSVAEFAGPPGHVVRDGVPGSTLDPAQRAAIHAAATEHDRQALAEPVALDGYGINVDLSDQGLIAVEASAEAGGGVAYRVRWFPAVPGAAQGTPARAVGLVLRIATALSGEIAGSVA